MENELKLTLIMYIIGAILAAIVWYKKINRLKYKGKPYNVFQKSYMLLILSGLSWFGIIAAVWERWNRINRTS